MKSLYIVSLLFLALSGWAQTSPNDSLKKLIEGNKRYVSGKPLPKEDLAKRREKLTSSQGPFATIVGCSDSRVPPELIFDQGLGDLFVVRVAGNVVGPLELDSVQFAADKLGAPLILVLGHQRCGAVQAVLNGQAIENDMGNIEPFIEKAVELSQSEKGDPLVNAIQMNVRLSVQALQQDSVLQPLIQKKRLKIVGGYYSLVTGKVEIL